MAQFIAVYDSCVLYPAPLRDLLMRLALTDLYHAKWTQEIHKNYRQTWFTRKWNPSSKAYDRYQGPSFKGEHKVWEQTLKVL